jgi:hypothetical protein
MPKTKSQAHARKKTTRSVSPRPKTRVQLEPDQLAVVHERAARLGMTVTGYLRSIIVDDQYPPGVRQIGRAMMECADIVRRALGVADWDETEKSRNLTMKVLSTVLLMEFSTRVLSPGEQAMMKSLPVHTGEVDLEDSLKRLALSRKK